MTEAAAAPLTTPPRSGFEFGIPPGGLTEYNQGLGVATQTDRRSMMTQLFEAFLACPWAWSSVNAIARTITAGGLVTDWVNPDGDGDAEQPQKPENVLALERLLAYCNPREDIRQLLRSTIADLLVFGDAYIEVVWWLGVPVALYTLDSPAMLPIADEHGEISGYVQITDNQQRAEFAPHEVIHISLDAPRSGVFGISPTQAAMLPITAWLFAAATLKETYRKGNPPNVHADLPRDNSPAEINRWTQQYMVRNVGPRNIGNPVVTKGGGTIKELQHTRITEALATLDQKRDEILACYGVPPAEVGVIESGNIGGGTGESQRKTYETNTCDPIGAILLEKLVYALVTKGFGITGWTLKFPKVDMRDSKVIEEIREKRIRTGQWTLNRARADIGEPPVEGGDVPMFLDAQHAFAWRDVVAYVQATIAAKLRGTGLDPGEPADEDRPIQLVRTSEPVDPANDQGEPDDDQPGPPELVDPTGKKTVPDDDQDEKPDESYRRFTAWHRDYSARRAEALETLPRVAA
ncbi:phage portal protein [Saccharothrix hoggarensis]|uniref:Phage portal protein n=1 Tax=Saccharothrix hoggarensis TaxID=913853 RepID=A0ABW3QHV0_9PSEU